MNTPRCQGVQILVKELKLKYKFTFLVEYCDVRSGIQKTDKFLRLNTNGKIPVLLDNNFDTINTTLCPFTVMESGAIMIFEDPLQLSDMYQWIEWGTAELVTMTHELIDISRR
ncbi:hypothetical protein PtB15_7B378 [Puccinia triticina]|nr:hypothetical protein PtB15_7B378 [Puccinia triticina]